MSDTSISINPCMIKEDTVSPGCYLARKKATLLDLSSFKEFFPVNVRRGSTKLDTLLHRFSFFKFLKIIIITKSQLRLIFTYWMSLRNEFIWLNLDASSYQCKYKDTTLRNTPHHHHIQMYMKIKECNNLIHLLP